MTPLEQEEARRAALAERRRLRGHAVRQLSEQEWAPITAASQERIASRRAVEIRHADTRDPSAESGTQR